MTDAAGTVMISCNCCICIRMNSQPMNVWAQQRKHCEPLALLYLWKYAKLCFSCSRKSCRWMACEINSRCHYSCRLCNV